MFHYFPSLLGIHFYTTDGLGPGHWPLVPCGLKSESHSVMSVSLWPHGLYSPWNFPGQNTGVGSLFLLQGIFPTQASNLGLLHCRRFLYHLSHKRSPRILEWVAYPFSSKSFWPRSGTGVSCTAGGFLTSWATREAQDSALSRPRPGLSLWREIKILLQAAAGWGHLRSAALRQEWDALRLGWKKVERCSFFTVRIKLTLEANFWDSLKARISRTWTIYLRKQFLNLEHPLKILRRAVRQSQRVEEVTGSWISMLAHLKLTWGALKNDLCSGSLPDPLIQLFYLHIWVQSAMRVENHERWDVCNPQRRLVFPGLKAEGRMEKRTDLRKDLLGSHCSGWKSG